MKHSSYRRHASFRLYLNYEEAKQVCNGIATILVATLEVFIKTSKNLVFNRASHLLLRIVGRRCRREFAMTNGETQTDGRDEDNRKHFFQNKTSKHPFPKRKGCFNKQQACACRTDTKKTECLMHSENPFCYFKRFSSSAFFSSYPGLPRRENMLTLYASTPGWSNGFTPNK